MTVFQLENMVQSEPDFLSLVRYYAVKAAIAVTNEDGATARHADRVTLAAKILANPDGYGHLMAHGIIANSTIAGRSDLDDVLNHQGDIEFQMNSMYDSYTY